jgi:hypothetical protein
MPDPIKPAIEWKEAIGQSYEQLREEAHRKKMERENLQPMALGKGRYRDIFKVGDRTRPELAMTIKRPEDSAVGSGEMNLEEIIPQQALKDLADAYAGANVTAMGEGMEGVRETVTYDADEAEQLQWTGHPQRQLLQPHVQEQSAGEPEGAAYLPEIEDE